MANSDRPAGLKPVKYMNGTPWNGAVRMYYIDGSNSAVYKGTPVKLDGSADSSGKTPSVDLYDTSNPILGVAVGFANQRNLATDVTDLERDYCPANTAMYVAVVDDPNVIFEAQEDNGSSAHMEAGDVGQMIALASGSGGSTTTGLSAAELDSDGNASNTASHTAQFQVLGVVDREDNEFGSSADHTKWHVRIADHMLTTDNAGATVGA